MQHTWKPQTLIQVAASSLIALIMVGAFFVAGGLSPVQAKGHHGDSGGPGNSGQYKPGCGYGDTNHTHTGAPGNPNACSSSSESTTRSSSSRSSTTRSSTTSQSTTRTMTSSSSSSSGGSGGKHRKHHKKHHRQKHKKKGRG